MLCRHWIYDSSHVHIPIYIYIYIYIYMYVYTHTYIHTHTHTCIHTRIHSQLYVLQNLCIDVEIDWALGQNTHGKSFTYVIRVYIIHENASVTNGSSNTRRSTDFSRILCVCVCVCVRLHCDVHDICTHIISSMRSHLVSEIAVLYQKSPGNCTLDARMKKIMNTICNCVYFAGVCITETSQLSMHVLMFLLTF